MTSSESVTVKSLDRTPDSGHKYMRAISIDSGKIAWETMQFGTVLAKDMAGRPRHCWRHCLLWRPERRPHCSRPEKRDTVVALRHECADESFSHDFYGSWETVCGNYRGIRRFVLWSARLRTIARQLAGATRRDRTGDPRITNAMLYQLS
jgi:hypothetical protein